MQSLYGTISGIINLKGTIMPLKVLTIDDDSSMTELLGVLLRSHGMDVYSCNSGAQGIELANLEKPDIIILDLILPETDGWEVCKALRVFTSAPIAILSALDDPGMISAALDAGADDYMTKPIASHVLIAHIKNLTRRYRVENNISTMIREVGFADISTQSLNPR
jgi:DNA-binding response OmpR family regulator